jgi:hypothetical protein
MKFAPGGAANGSSLAAQILSPARCGYWINSGSYWNSFIIPAAVRGIDGSGGNRQARQALLLVSKTSSAGAHIASLEI